MAQPHIPHLLKGLREKWLCERAGIRLFEKNRSFLERIRSSTMDEESKGKLFEFYRECDKRLQ